MLGTLPLLSHLVLLITTCSCWGVVRESTIFHHDFASAILEQIKSLGLWKKVSYSYEIVFPFYRWNWLSERTGNLPRVTQLVGVKVEFRWNYKVFFSRLPLWTPWKLKENSLRMRCFILMCVFIPLLFIYYVSTNNTYYFKFYISSIILYMSFATCFFIQHHVFVV